MRKAPRAEIPFVGSIVHATDLSAAGESAFAHALGIALLRRASLTILHVGTEPARDWSRLPAVRRTLERWKLMPEGSAKEDVFEQLGIRVTKLAISGRFPALAVTDYLDRSPADLLVVATEGREGPARWLHGSVAEAMARWSKTMTLFVPNDAERTLVAAADGDLTLSNVLIPVDQAPDPSAAIEFAQRAARVAGDGRVMITLLHVGAADAAPRAQTADGEGFTFQRMRREGDPVEQIVAVADELRAELVVMPTAGRSGVFEALGGSTTERVLRRMRCPVLAVPAVRPAG
jgi:nucleotide-binding universal stress UspA family protein